MRKNSEDPKLKSKPGSRKRKDLQRQLLNSTKDYKLTYIPNLLVRNGKLYINDHLKQALYRHNHEAKVFIISEHVPLIKNKGGQFMHSLYEMDIGEKAPKLVESVNDKVIKTSLLPLYLSKVSGFLVSTETEKLKELPFLTFPQVEFNQFLELGQGSRHQANYDYHSMSEKDAGPGPSDNTQSSLVTSWGEGKQGQWNQLKSEAIACGKLYIEHKPRFIDFYELLARERRSIANSLDQEHKIKLGQLRSPSKKGDYDTPILCDRGPYTSFYPYLHARYSMLVEELPVQTITPVGFAHCEMHIPAGNTIDSYTAVRIKLDKDTELTCIELAQGVSPDQSNMSWMRLVHTPNRNLEAVINQVEPLYNELLNNTDLCTEKVEELIKKICWYLSHGMLCERGSAAITEMIVHILCDINGIDCSYPRGAVPMDLVAIYTHNVDEFVKLFSLNPVRDCQNELIQLLALEMQGTKKVHFFGGSARVDMLKKMQDYVQGREVEFSEADKLTIQNFSPLVEIISKYKLNGFIPVNFLPLEAPMRQQEYERPIRSIKL